MSLFQDMRKRFRDGDRTELYRFLMIWAVTFGVFSTVQVIVGGVPLMFLTILPFLSAVVVVIILEKFGRSISGAFYRGPKAVWDPKEQFAADLAKIKVSKAAGEFGDALAFAGNYLKRFPNDPEALLLKAQILQEGFGYTESALKCLETILKEEPPSSRFHKWAAAYRREIADRKAERQSGSTNQ